MTKIKGIDISEHQGKISLDSFKKVKDSGISFVILRTSYTGYSTGNLNKDSVFENNYANAIKAGLDIGVYHYSGATSKSKAISEAEYVLNIIKGKTIKYPVYIDVEENRNCGKCSKSTLATVCGEFCKVILNAGYIPGVYASLSWFNNKIGTITIQHTKWVAQYNSTCDYKGSYDMWQYSSSGNVKGLSGRIDMNYCYKEFVNNSNTSIPIKEEISSKQSFNSTLPKLPLRGYFKRGDKGTQVKYLQKFLNWYKDYNLVVDGCIGTKTINATEKYQKSETLDVDGLFGKKCLERAKELIK